MAVRADTIAACASAVAAVASAVVAGYAIVLALHQEDIARNQLKASYLSNLYGRQIDTISALDASVGDVIGKGAAGGGVFCTGNEDPARLVAQAAGVNKEMATLTTAAFQRWDLLRYSVPGEFGEYAHRVLDTVQDLYHEVARFSSIPAPSAADLATYCSNTETIRKRYYHERTALFGCVRPIFTEGSPITQERLKDCALTPPRLEGPQGKPK
jgi:hypothetical protein